MAPLIHKKEYNALYMIKMLKFAAILFFIHYILERKKIVDFSNSSIFIYNNMF